ncbi:MAG: M20/M25/M40 family metallo-hydrolase [Lentisphaeria bacterium]|nr:M20/M25/M40 family metallo-hydrolase [Lentisphaeria bacterium]
MHSQEMKNRIGDLVKQIRENPELSGEEVFACALQTAFLRERGFTLETPIAGEKTAYKAVFTVHSGAGEGEKIPSFAFCAEYDALPHVKHGCGHPLIMGSALAAAVELKALLEEKGVPGRIIVLGCPAEETYGGKIRIAESGAAEEADAFLMAHPVSGFSALGDVAYSGIRSVKIVFRGSGGSGAARMANPAFVNPLDAQNLLYGAVAMRRHFFPRDVAIAGVISDGGKRANLLPVSCESNYTVRSQDPAHLEEYTLLLRTMAEGASLMTGTEAEVTFGKPWLPTRPNKVLNKSFLDAMEKRGFKADRTPPCRGGCFAGTDFGKLSQMRPACHLHFPIMKAAAAHTEEFARISGEAPAAESMFAAGESMAETAFAFLADEKFRASVKEAFTQDVFEE